MNFLRATLERCLQLQEQQMEVKRLLDCMTVVVHDDPQRQKLMQEFLNKWKQCSSKTLQGMMLVSISGTWTSQCFSQPVPVTRWKQPDWKSFVLRYCPDYTHFQVSDHDRNSLDYQPLNFKELVQMTFWKEMYEAFGFIIVSHIFEKCTLLYEAEEGLYLVLAYSESAIYRRLTKYDNGKFSCSSSRVSQSQVPYTTGRNPYQLADQAATFGRPSGVQNSNKRKVTTQSDGKQSGSSVQSTTAKADATMLKPIGVSSQRRWIKPTPELLKKIIDLREEMLQSCDIPSSCTVGLAGLTVLNFILVQTDKDFTSPNKRLILKQKAEILTKHPVLPTAWDGLKLPNNLFEITNGSKSFQLHVYVISETAAKEIGVRIKPKGRSRRKGNPSLSLRNLHLAESSQNALSSFVPSVALPVGNCLYNKSSWSKWPSHHSLHKAASNSLQDMVLATRLVVDDILSVPISLKPAHDHLGEVMSKNWKSLSKRTFALNCTIQRIVQLHGKFKNIHKLFKSCLSFWRIKYVEKEDRKRKKRKPSCVVPTNQQQTGLQAQTSKASTTVGNVKDCVLVSGPSRDLISISSNSSSVHLTQSTSTTHFSGSPQRIIPVIDISSQKKIANNESSISHVKGTTKRVSKRKLELVRKYSGLSAKTRSFRSLKYPVPYNCVMQSLKQIFHIMKIDELLGSARNIRGFFTFVRKAIILGGTKSSLHLGELMALIHPCDTPFAQVCGYDKLATETFVAKFVTWLFNQYVLVLLKTSFYITECGFTRFHLRFYLRESWTGATHKMKDRLIQKGVLTETSVISSQNAVLRFVPKQNHSLRSLLIKKKSECRFLKYEINVFKMFLHHVDSKITKSRMHIPTTIQYEWKNFVIHWKSEGFPRLYFLRMDIQDAYPTVSLEKLREVLVESARGVRLVQKKFLLFCGSGRKIYRESFFDEHHRRNWHSGIHIRPCLVLDMEQDRITDAGNIVNDITALLTTSSVVKIGRRIYDFSYGLPQGWSLSPILCSIYYGYIDAKLYMPYLQKRGCLFFRVVDDYLFVTPDAMQVLNLMTLMKIGCENYGIKLNQEKSQTNIFVRADAPISSITCETVTFCGWKICLSCGHVSRDYQKYSGQDFCSTITFQLPNLTLPEQFIRLRGTLLMPARLKPILLDSTINCPKRILLTTFEASIILGFRFYALCRVVYPSLNAVKEAERANHLYLTIYICCSRLARFVKRHCPEAQGNIQPTRTQLGFSSCGTSCCGTTQCSSMVCQPQKANILGTLNNLTLSHDILLYTSLVGFRLKLVNHSEAFKNHVLPKLNCAITKLSNTLGSNCCALVDYIIGNEMPASLQNIRI